MFKTKSDRWFVILGALLIQISLGAIYIYSVFKPALKGQFPQWSATDLALPSQAVLAFFALSMIVSGRLQDRFGPKKIATLGAIILMAGMYVAAKAQSLEQFVLGFGLLGGIGIGAAYVCPIATCVKWFPDKRGFVTGLSVAGFGAGGLIFTPLATYFISRYGIMPAFLYLGLIFFASIVIGAQLMTIPPAGYCPAGWTPPAALEKHTLCADLAPKEILKTRRFWLLWTTYFIGCTAGLLVIMNVTNIWQALAVTDVLKTTDTVSKNIFTQIVAAGAAAVMVVAILNSLGRIVWGMVSDRVGREKTLMGVFILCGLAMFALNNATNYGLFLTDAAIVGFCFGGFLALYPAIATDYFGTKSVGANYGLLFSAYGAGGLFGPWLAPKLLANIHKLSYEAAGASGATIVKSLEVGSYSDSFIVAGTLCLIGAVIILNLGKPAKD